MSTKRLAGDFLWDLAHKSNREKFKFDFQEAFNASKGNQAAIAVNEMDAQYTIVQRIFEYLKEDPVDQTNNFGLYAVENLPHHLDRLRSLQHEKQRPLRSHELQEIGKNLYILFKDKEVFERHKDCFKGMYWGVEDMQAIRDWLTDSWVVMGIEDMPWRDQVKQVYSPARGYLQVFTRLLIEELLRKRSISCRGDWTFEWLQELIKAVS